MIMHIYITHESFFMPLCNTFLSPPDLRQPLICFVTIDYFAFSRILYQWINKVQIILFFPAYFTWHSDFEIHLYCCVYWWLMLVYGVRQGLSSIILFYFIFTHGYLIASAPFVENSIFSPLNPLLKISWPSVFGSFPGLFILFHWPLCLSSHQCHPVFILQLYS